MKQDIRISVLHLYEHAKILLKDLLVYRPALLEFLQYFETFLKEQTSRNLKIFNINFIKPFEDQNSFLLLFCSFFSSLGFFNIMTS
jgi:hypothetical protein